MASSNVSTSPGARSSSTEWVIDEHMHTDLVRAASTTAVVLHSELAAQVILHAARGCQYTSAQLARFACEHNLFRLAGRTTVG